MKAKCLRIGNKVQDNNGFVFDVVSVFKDGTVYCDFKENEGDVWEFDNNNHCQGIELTEEILLKCGFLNFGNRWMCSELPLDIIMSNGFYMANVVNEIKYLHQLQNLYFALTGEELEIK